MSNICIIGCFVLIKRIEKTNIQVGMCNQNVVGSVAQGIFAS